MVASLDGGEACEVKHHVRSVGYGVEGVSVASLLVATNTCERMVFHPFSPVKLRVNAAAASAAPEFEGLVLAAVHRVVAAPPSWRHKAGALLFTLLRPDLPNMVNYMTTYLVFLYAVSLDETHLRRLYRSRPRRHMSAAEEFVPIKVLYTAAMPIVLHAAAVSALCIVSHQLYLHNSGSFLVNLLGKWEQTSNAGGAAYPVGGLAYYMTPPSRMLEEPGLIHGVFVVLSCTRLYHPAAAAVGGFVIGGDERGK